MKQTAYIILFLIGITVFCTTVFMPSCNPKTTETSPAADTSYLNILRQQAEHAAKEFHTKALVLEKVNDSLSAQLTIKQLSLNTYRSKARALEHQLSEDAAKADAMTGDSLQPRLNTYITQKQMSDSLCDESISALKLLVGNKDEELQLCRLSQSAERDLSKEQQAQILRFGEELSTAYKVQKRKTIQNRFLAAGLLIVTGVASGLLIHKSTH